MLYGSSAPPEQGAGPGFEDFKKALAQVPVDQREALLLVGTPVVRGDAQVCGVAVRQDRKPREPGRTRLSRPLAVEHGEEPASGPTFNSALQDLWLLDTSPTTLSIL